MSFHGRNRSASQSTRQEWIPRGSSSATITVESSSPATSNSTSNVNQASTPNDDRYRQTGLPTNHRRNGEKERAENHVAVRKEIHPNLPQLLQEIIHKQSINHRRDRKKERSTNHVAVRKEIDPNLPQLVQEIQDKLIKSTVECMICCDMVNRSGTIWSCSSCYSIFHLNCIKKWAKAPTSVDLVAEKNLGFNWRCPGCQSVQFTSSKEIRYVCFCGKRNDPPPDLYLIPHSCGEPCGKPLEKELGLGSGVMKDELCPHICVLQCHPGPCPPCKAFAPPRLCPCGKKVITTRCSDRKSFLTCGQQCDKLLECGRHHCERVCHVGACDPCKVLISAPCFCKKKVDDVICGDMVVKGEVKAEDGIFSCNSTCGKKLRCGNHYCAEICHPGPCGDCEFVPSKIKSCYCGKTSLQDRRQSCLDPIPTCSEICEKFLPCQVHRCDQACHAGSCPPCLVLVTQKCLCGSTSRRVECYKTTLENERFKCDKPCGRKKNCGRHRCSERCCPLSNSNNLGSGNWDPHFCQMACGKKLRCGQHSCESLCHSGHCPPCLETIFTDLTCACGRTSIPPPLPCGTPPPSCQLPCSVPQACGHSSSHSCHFGDCPPCSVPVAKECTGGHVLLRNIPCGSKDIRCNKLCGKTRQCGLHACGRMCHPAPCDASSGGEQGFRASCGQTCGAPRQDCRHTCTAPCHPSAPCPDVRCDFRVTIACSCCQRSATVPCDAGGFNADTVFEASIIQKLPSPLQPVESAGKRIPLGQRKLMCDDECAKLERKRALADAFDITPPNLDSLHFGENSVTSELIFDLYRRDPKWVLAVEERCKFLVLGKNRGTTTGLKFHVFCPMLKDKRDAVRMIAERWKLAISAAGWEPKCFVVVHATPKSKLPARIIGGKRSISSGSMHPPVFDLLVDMDPRLVVSFLDLPREADISALVLRFGGECELVWMNDKNALAVFGDPARAATAMRRLDHGSIYTGATTFVHSGGASAPNNAWGGTGPSSAVKENPWKKNAVQELGWGEHSWGGNKSLGGISNPGSAWTDKDTPIPASINRWSVLDSGTGVSSSSGAIQSEDPSKLVGVQSMLTMDSNASNSNSAGLLGGSLNETEPLEVVDDWEKAYE
ncbi:NF-X1-type zinc finger protein NFXL1 [Hibiscus syriacus]|uniref:NF-X1-type zinc finger protein NFXL1 n=1 Tax=Hibiscus syriacus TaxID=106335 RepID=A0A6A2YJ80_HIBSY|nr:NF-X1-type zinc finger protein NFXL1-like [Hibiscus syriacus]XP_039031341.1 NF-X1-type zinc finger protein NFXL1-like [Hibiscus syriacus]KAE8676134.1 NF-X1-type zinc finger protein NFXL1 [Hibiscus syriacus]